MSFTKIYALDAATGLIKREPAQAAITADGYIGSQHDQLAATATDCVLVANIEAIDISSGDETYKFYILGSNVANRSDAEVLGFFQTGKASALTGSQETRDGAAGDRHVVPFRTEKNRTKFRYVDLYLDVGGTTPSIIVNAYISKEI